MPRMPPNSALFIIVIIVSTIYQAAYRSYMVSKVKPTCSFELWIYQF